MASKKVNESHQQESVVVSVSLPATVSHCKEKDTKQLLVCIQKQTTGPIEFYDRQRNRWHKSSVELQVPNEQELYQLALIDSVLYAFGGRDNRDVYNNLVWSRDLNDPSSQSWTARASMNHPDRALFSSVLLNDSIYALGGRSETVGSYLRSVERYDSQLNQWSTVADMNSEREYASAVVLNGCIYIAGGTNGLGAALQSVERYDPQADTWTEVAPMITGRYRFALVSFAGRLWAIGGWGWAGMVHLSSVESYDPVTDTWREEAPLKEGRWSHAAVEFNGELYVIGGHLKNDFGYTKATEKYVPTIGWVEGKRLWKRYKDPQLLIIQPSCSSFFTSGSKKNFMKKILNWML